MNKKLRPRKLTSLLDSGRLKSFGLVAVGLLIALGIYSFAFKPHTLAMQESDKNMPTLSGDAAVEYLKKDASYRSLDEAITSIRLSERPNSPEAAARLSPSDPVLNTGFGIQVAISGDTAVVARVQTGTSNSAVYVFVRNGSTWTQQQKLIPGHSDPSSFGYDVAISGDTIVVGEVYYTGGGAASVFVRSGTSWTLQQRLRGTDTVNNDQFGYRVSLSGETVVVTANNDANPVGTDTGSAYVFVRNGSFWTQQQKLTSAATSTPFSTQANSYGDSVGISGDTIIVGKIREDIGVNTNQGAIFVYVRNGTTWTQQQRLTDPNITAGGIFGYSSAISGDTIIGYGANQVYVFVRTGTTWTEQQRLTAPDIVPNDYFGLDLSLSGDLAVIGAHRSTIGGNQWQGSAYIFRRCGTAWIQQEKLVAADGIPFDWFGYSVGISGDAVIAGAPQVQTFGQPNRPGTAYIFQPVGVSLRPEGGQCDTSIEVNVTSDEPDFDLTDTLCDVNLTTDGKQCSLRAAIQNANKADGFDIITFNIPGGGVQTISPASPLPVVTDKVIINGTSQPGYLSSPMIELRGDNAGNESGIVFGSGSSESKLAGMIINRFAQAGVVLSSNGNRVENSYIGLNSDGLTVDLLHRQRRGVQVLGADNIIGGNRTGTSPNNLIAGNEIIDVRIEGLGSKRNIIKGNSIGLNRNQTPFNGASLDGVYLSDAGDSNVVGGSTASESNTITSVIGVRIENASYGDNGNTVAGNRILGCLIGVSIINSGSNTIGGDRGSGATSSSNHIGRNTIGISLKYTVDDVFAFLVDENKIYGNFIGISPEYPEFGNDLYGVDIEKGVNNFIGSGQPEQRNIISENSRSGVYFEVNAKMNIVQGNYIGTDPGGTLPKGNHDGISIAGSQNRVTGNVISGNIVNGVEVLTLNNNPAPQGNIIENNRIGIAASENTKVPNNDNGILLFGGKTTVTGNTISGNSGDGVGVFSNENTITGNNIGTDPTGNSAVGNDGSGIFIPASLNTITGNTISGNLGGILIAHLLSDEPIPSNNIIQGNFIGTNSHGTVALGNIEGGIIVGNNAVDNRIGGTTAGSGNVISGNGGAGIKIEFAGIAGAIAPFETKIQGNFIGTNLGGTSAIRNTGAGIEIIGGISTKIGGFGADIPGARNLISGNGGDGINLADTSVLNRIYGNYIGTKADGTSPLGNTGNGVLIGNGCSSNIVGGTEPNSGNTIGFNAANGILLSADAGNNNLIDPNRIFGNALRGIDIGGDGFTANDPTDADVGPNKRQNFPTMTFSVNGGGDLIVNYQVDSAPQHSSYGAAGIYVEFFEADATGAGSNFLGSDHFLLSDYTSGTPGTRQKNLGNAAALGFAPNDKMTATATDADGNSSEFTPAVSGPAASPVNVGGRVTTPTGIGLRNAAVTMIDALGVRRTATTSSFGIYSFTNVAAGGSYTITVVSKRYRFAPRVMVISDNISNADFVGLE